MGEDSGQYLNLLFYPVSSVSALAGEGRMLACYCQVGKVPVFYLAPAGPWLCVCVGESRSLLGVGSSSSQWTFPSPDITVQWVGLLLLRSGDSWLSLGILTGEGAGTMPSSCWARHKSGLSVVLTDIMVGQGGGCSLPPGKGETPACLAGILCTCWLFQCSASFSFKSGRCEATGKKAQGTLRHVVPWGLQFLASLPSSIFYSLLVLVLDVWSLRVFFVLTCRRNEKNFLRRRNFPNSTKRGFE